MKKVENLYMKYVTEEKYKNLNEVKILTSIYDMDMGSLQLIISKAINEAVLNHMDLTIDSTIMQVLALNEYLSAMFIRNFDILMHNYVIHYLEKRKIEEITDEQYGKIEKLVLQTDMKDSAEEFIEKIKNICSLEGD